MNDLYIFLLLLFVIIVVVVVLLVIFLPKPRLYLPYLKKPYLLTRKERELFSILNDCVPNTYYVFPQIHIASIIEVKKYEKEWQRYFNKIISKSIDFVIFDKENISPILAIELDDNTHMYEKRIIRDEFVNNLFEEVQIKLYRIKTSSLDNRDALKKEIIQLLETARAV